MAFAPTQVLSGPAYERIEKGALDELVITIQSLFKRELDKIKVLSTARMLGEVIRRVYNNESVNSLFNLK